MRSSRSIVAGVAVLAALVLPMVAGAADKLIVQDGNIKVQKSGADKMVVTDTGRIGVGTTLPDAAIHVKAVGTVAYPDNSIKVEGNATSGSGGFIGYLTKSGGLPTIGERIGFVYFGSYDSITNPAIPAPLHATGLKAAAEKSWTTSSTPSFFAFETTPELSKTRVERMRISANGNVGIGTTGTPTSKLQVVGLPQYSNNAAAVAGGLTVGAFYRTGGDPDLVAVVH